MTYLAWTYKVEGESSNGFIFSSQVMIVKITLLQRGIFMIGLESCNSQTMSMLVSFFSARFLETGFRNSQTPKSKALELLDSNFAENSGSKTTKLFK